MSNLIPPDAKRAVVIEYWIRVVTVWFVLVGLALVVTALMKTPTFVLVESQLRAFSGEYEEAVDESNQFDEAQRAITDANQLAELLKGGNDTTELSSIIAILDEIAGDAVTIQNFDLNMTDGMVTKISIDGTAATRQALAGFSENIEAHPLFSDAELPISNLAKDRDIGFSISVVPVTES